MDDFPTSGPTSGPASAPAREMPSDEQVQQKFDRLLERLSQSLPRRIAVAVAWVVRPEMIWVRAPLALVLIIGGVFSFLPLLGIWMLPLGVMLLAIDVGLVRRWVVRTWPKIEARIRLYRAKRAKAKQQ